MGTGRGASCRPPNTHPIQTPRYMHLYRLPHLYTHPPIGPPMYMHLYTDPHTCICTDSPIYMHPYIDSPNTHPIQTLLYIHASLYRPSPIYMRLYTDIPPPYRGPQSTLRGAVCAPLPPSQGPRPVPGRHFPDRAGSGLHPHPGLPASDLPLGKSVLVIKLNVC